MTYEQKLRRALIALIVCICTFIIIMVVSLINEYLWDLEWIKTVFDLSSLFLNIGCLVFSIYMWRLYQINSYKSEAEHKESFDKIKDQYPDLDLTPTFDHKKRRKQMSILHGCVILINLICISANLFIW